MCNLNASRNSGYLNKSARFTSFDVFEVFIDKEKYGNVLHVSEGHRELRCPVWSCICSTVFVTKQNTATLLTALLFIGPACRPSAVSVTD